MKFINYLESITGIGIYPLISFLIFFLFFLGVTFYVIRTGKKHFEEVSKIALDANQNEFIYEK